MRFDINDFRTDDDKKTAGVWIDFGGGAEFKIAALTNTNFTAAFQKATKPYTDLGKDIPGDDQEAIMMRLMSIHVVLDWKGVFDGDDELPYSIENAERLLSELEWLRTRIVKEAQRIDNFKAAKREETSGNSERA